jgi:hypothetical protein
VRLPKPGDDLLDQFVPHLIRRALKEGDRTAVRLCVERVRPTRRGVALSFRLPAIPSAEDAERAVEKVTEAGARATAAGYADGKPPVAESAPGCARENGGFRWAAID